jgi:hypothetical protein
MIYLHVGGVPHTLESYQKELQLSFKLHFNQKYSQEIMGFQSHRSPNSQDKMTFGCKPRG